MNILIIGNGFLGKNLAGKFAKEGFHCFILEKGPLPKTKAYHERLDAADKKCQKVFDLYNIDCVFYTAAPQENTLLDAQAGLAALSHILALSAQNKISHFYFFTDLADNFALTQQHYAFFQLEAAALCKKYAAYYQLPVTLLQTANLYAEEGLLSGGTYPRLFCDWQQSGAAQEAPAFTTPQNFLHLNDALEAITKFLGKAAQPQEVMLAAPYKLSYSQGKDFLQQPCPAETVVNIVQDIRHDAARDIVAYKFSPPQEQAAAAPAATFTWRKYLPLLENVLLFAAVALLSYFMPAGNLINTLGIGYCQIYIIIIALLYGKSQATIAAVLSIALFFYELAQNKVDFVVVFYHLPYQIHIIAYLFMALFVGYISDKHSLEQSQARATVEKTQSEYDFLKKSYHELLALKNKFYRQILNSTDSIGWLYNSIHRLYNTESERIYTATIQVVTELMQTENSAIYVTDSKGIFLRQKITTGPLTTNLPKSLALDAPECAFLKDICTNHTLFVNKTLQHNRPDMAMPIVSSGRTIAIIALYKIPFEYFSAHYEKMLRLTALMVAEALEKAASFERETYVKRHFPQSGILREEPFRQIEAELRRRKNIYGKFQLLSCNDKTCSNLDLEQQASPLYAQLKSMMRENDFIGVDAGQIFILMPEFVAQTAPIIIERFAKRAVQLKLIDTKAEVDDNV